MVRVGRESSRHQTTSVVSPKVQIMAMPEPFSGSASSWARTGTRTPNSGVTHLGAEQGPVAVVVGVGDEGHAGGRAARAGSSRSRPPPGVVGPRAKRDAVVGARTLAVLELGLGHRGLEVDVPEGRRLALYDLAPPSRRRKPRWETRWARSEMVV